MLTKLQLAWTATMIIPYLKIDVTAKDGKLTIEDIGENKAYKVHTSLKKQARILQITQYVWDGKSDLTVRCTLINDAAQEYRIVLFIDGYMVTLIPID